MERWLTRNKNKRAVIMWNILRRFEEVSFSIINQMNGAYCCMTEDIIYLSIIAIGCEALILTSMSSRRYHVLKRYRGTDDVSVFNSGACWWISRVPGAPRIRTCQHPVYKRDRAPKSISVSGCPGH